MKMLQRKLFVFHIHIFGFCQSANETTRAEQRATCSSGAVGP